MTIEHYVIAGVVRPEIACTGCGYDLRGQPRGGQCPECGQPVEATIADLERKRLRAVRPLAEAGRAWLTQAFEGSVLTLIASGLASLLAVLPQEFFRRKTHPREVMLGLACTAWVLSGYGCWKMTANARDPFRPWHARRGNAARILIACYTAIPFLMPWMISEQIFLLQAVAMAFAISMVVTLFVLPIMLWCIWSYWFRQAERHAMKILCWIGAVLAPIYIVFCGLIASGGEGPSSLEMLMSLPQWFFGSPYLTRQIVEYWIVHFPERVFAIAFLGSSVLMMAINVKVALMLRSARRNAQA